MTNIKYCESIHNYKFSNYIAEYFNTISSLLFIAMGLYGLCKKELSFKFYLSELLIILVGIGSAIFHGNQSYVGEVLDETAMLLLLFSYYLHVVLNTPLQIISFIILGCITFLYFYYNSYVLFLILFGGGLSTLVVYVYKLYIVNKLVIIGILSVAVLLWMTEQYYYKNNICPLELNNIKYYYHSLWHILCAVTHRLHLNHMYYKCYKIE